jgi:hypothetical protein
MLIGLEANQIITITPLAVGWNVDDGTEVTGPHLSIMVAPVTMTISTVGLVGPETVRIATSPTPILLRGTVDGVEMAAAGGVGFTVNGAIRFISDGVAPSEDPTGGGEDAPV